MLLELANNFLEFTGKLVELPGSSEDDGGTPVLRNTSPPEIDPDAIHGNPLEVTIIKKNGVSIDTNYYGNTNNLPDTTIEDIGSPYFHGPKVEYDEMFNDQE